MDSPGLLDFEEEREFIQKIIHDADVLFFVIDDTVGITAKEQHILGCIMDNNKKQNTILVINKIDVRWKQSETELAISDYYDLGFDHMLGISAKTGRNLDYLEEALTEVIKEQQAKIQERDPSTVILYNTTAGNVPIAILGKPNAGKSTLLNRIMGEVVSKVENIPGTTRDYITANIKKGKTTFTIYDTAGIRKKGTMHSIEKIAYTKTMDMIKYIRPVIVFMVDATEGITHRDLTILEEIQIQALPIMFCVNKSDLLTKKDIQHVEDMVVAHLDFAKYIPVLPISAKTGDGIEDIFRIAKEIRKEANKRIDTGMLNKILAEEYITRPPRFPRNKICKILYMTQTDVNAPTFIAFINHKDRANFAFKKWIENSLRKHFRFVGTPLVIKFKDRAEKREEKENEAKAEEINNQPIKKDKK